MLLLMLYLLFNTMYTLINAIEKDITGARGCALYVREFCARTWGERWSQLAISLLSLVKGEVTAKSVRS